MQRLQEPSLCSCRLVFLAPLVALFLVGSPTESQEPARHSVVPLHKMPSEQWVEKVWGDPSRPGEPFVMRIHNDAGYVVLPHTHPIDENIVVVHGVWALGTGRQFDRSALESLELGAYGFVPKTMAHFAWSKTETIIQMYGIGPFGSTLVDPVYELTEKGVLVLTSLLQPGSPTQSSPPDCFVLQIGTRVHSEAGDGTVVGARCSPANQLTQYWVRKPNGERFWATAQELKPM